MASLELLQAVEYPPVEAFFFGQILETMDLCRYGQNSRCGLSGSKFTIGMRLWMDMDL